MKNILGRKVGMTSVFTDDGRYVPVTVIAAGPCTVVERRTKESHGYDAVALGFEPLKRGRVTRAQAGHFKKQGVDAVRVVREFRGPVDGVEQGAIDHRFRLSSRAIVSTSRASPKVTASPAASNGTTSAAAAPVTAR